jgi:homoserine O-acetyltransferase/O-succinyltransferase
MMNDELAIPGKIYCPLVLLSIHRSSFSPILTFPDSSFIILTIYHSSFSPFTIHHSSLSPFIIHKMSLNKFIAEQPFQTESGEVLPRLEIAYHTYGQRNADDSNIIWVCHALTANSDVMDWWKGLFGEGRLLDPQKYFIICANNLGSCYGTSGPLSLDPDTGKPFYHHFPDITIRDMVKAHDILREHLGIKNIHLLIGGSQGGQQALEWSVEKPELFEKLIIIATNARHSAWGIAFNESQRMAIAADPTWIKNEPHAGLEGMKVARSIALLSYRNYHTYDLSQSSQDPSLLEDYPAASYQRYQGDKLAKRFNAFTYWKLSKAMDSHHLGRHRTSIEKSLSVITAETLVISISSDLLFPPEEQKLLARHIPGAIWKSIDSVYGHDGFLTETGALSDIIRSFLFTKLELVA